MSKQDYEAIAAAIHNAWIRPDEAERIGANQSVELAREDAARQIATQIAFNLSRDNKRFDRRKFLAACGLF